MFWWKSAAKGGAVGGGGAASGGGAPASVQGGSVGRFGRILNNFELISC